MPPFRPQDVEMMGDPEEWVWVDLFIQHERVVNWDVQTLNEVPDGSAERLYASHVLEHISHVQVPEVLATWQRKLQPGGSLTINVPDMEWIAEAILGRRTSSHYQTWWGRNGWVAVLYGLQDHPGEYHRSGFTHSSLIELLARAGFEQTTIRHEYDAHEMGVLIAESQKPLN